MHRPITVTTGLAVASVLAGLGAGQGHEVFSTQLVDAQNTGMEPTLWISPDGTTYVAGTVPQSATARTWRSTANGYESIGNPSGGVDATIGGVVNGEAVHAGIDTNTVIRLSHWESQQGWQEVASNAGDRPYLTGYSGKLYVVYKTSEGPSQQGVRIRESTDRGQTWSSSVLIATLSGVHSPLVVTQQAGQQAVFHVLFWDSVQGQQSWRRAFTSSPLGTWTVETLPTKAYVPNLPDAAVDAAGRIYLIWPGRFAADSRNVTFFAFRNLQGQWNTEPYLLNQTSHISWAAGIVAGASGRAGAAWYESAGGSHSFKVIYRSVTIDANEQPILGPHVTVGDTFSQDMPERGMDIMNMTTLPDGNIRLVYSCLAQPANPDCGLFVPGGTRWYVVAATQVSGPRLW